MRYLLDTHVFLWLLGEADRLSRAARVVIDDSATSLLVSAVTAWEIAIKYRQGKMPEAASVIASYDATVLRLGAEPLSITAQHALAAGALDWDHRDPFDRLLAAQSRLEGLTLITSDRALLGYAGVRTLW